MAKKLPVIIQNNLIVLPVSCVSFYYEIRNGNEWRLTRKEKKKKNRRRESREMERVVVPISTQNFHSTYTHTTHRVMTWTEWDFRIKKSAR